MCRKPSFLGIISSTAMSFVSFLQEKKSFPPSFFRLEEKKQKKINCRTVVLLFFRSFSQCAAQNGRFAHEPSVFFVPSRMCGKPPFLRITSSTTMSFVPFLQEKKSFPLLFFLEEKKQKKSICGAVISLFSSCLRQRVTQNGRFAHEPSVFSFQAGCAANRLSSE